MEKSAKELMKALKEKNAIVTPVFYPLPGFEMENVILLIESSKEDPAFFDDIVEVFEQFGSPFFYNEEDIGSGAELDINGFTFTVHR